MDNFPNPFNPWLKQSPFQLSMPTANPLQPATSNQTPFDAKAVLSQTEMAAKKVAEEARPIDINLPRHLFIPRNAQSIDIRKLASAAAGTNKELFMSFTAPKGGITVFTHYAIYNDGAELCTNYLFLPEVNGNRIYPFHGDPDDFFRIKLGLSPDLGNEGLIPGYIELQPGFVLTWKLSNTGIQAANMGVRMSGYFSSSETYSTPSFGG
jgi:hypothetical protein